MFKEQLELKKEIKRAKKKVLKELIVPKPFYHNTFERNGGLDIEIYNTEFSDLKATTTTMKDGEYIQKYFNIDKMWEVNIVNSNGKYEKMVYIKGWQNVICQLLDNFNKIKKS